MNKYQDRSNLLICLLLAAVTLAVYWQAYGFGFVTIDDMDYVANNSHVLGGVTAGNVAWAFLSNHSSNWHPLTWISLMLDARIGDGSPGVFHLVNVILHVLNTLLLFILLLRMTGKKWRSAVVAVLFALHPLHVESVAWVTERKDVLSTFFLLLTLLAYVWYVKRPALRRYLLVALAYVLGLMAKPMLVSLPILLLLMDVWPLERTRDKSVSKLAIEKIPLCLLAAASCAVTYWAQVTGGSVAECDSIGVRLANAMVSYASYIIKMVCPLNLAMLYPHPGNHLPGWQVIGSGLFFALMLVVAIRSIRIRPYITMGWLWYVITLIPVIGLVQVGQQAMADRYTYVPLIGLFIILAWGIPELIKKPSPIWPLLGGVLLAGLVACTYFQISYWKDSTSLFEHAITVDNGNYLAHNGLGCAFAAESKDTEAIVEYLTALKLRPDLAQAHYNLGLVLAKVGRLPEAASHYSAALEAMPDNSDVHNNLGIALARMGRLNDAISHFKAALKSSPDDPEAHNNLGCVYAQKGDFANAVKQFEAVVRVQPDNNDAQEKLAKAKAELQKN